MHRMSEYAALDGPRCGQASGLPAPGRCNRMADADIDVGQAGDRGNVPADPRGARLVTVRGPCPVSRGALAWPDAGVWRRGPVEARQRVAGLVARALARGLVPLVEQLHLGDGPPVVLARPFPVTGVPDDLERRELDGLSPWLRVVRPVDHLVHERRAVDVVPDERRVDVRGEGHGAFEEPLDLGRAVEGSPEVVVVGRVRGEQL